MATSPLTEASPSSNTPALSRVRLCSLLFEKRDSPTPPRSKICKTDPHNKFCGDDECYAVLGLERGADKADIKKAYRTISLDVHPDKNPSAESKEKFTVRRAVSVAPLQSSPVLSCCVNRHQKKSSEKKQKTETKYGHRNIAVLCGRGCAHDSAADRPRAHRVGGGGLCVKGA